MLIIKSKYLFKPNFTYIIIIVLSIFQIFFSKYIPQENKQFIETIIAFSFVILFFIIAFSLAFYAFNASDLVKIIEELENKKEWNFKTNSYVSNDKILLKYKKALEKLSNKYEYVYIFKSIEEATDLKNLPNYFTVLVILFSGELAFDSINKFGPIIYLFLIGICIIISIIIVIWVVVKEKQVAISSPKLIGHIFAIYMLFNWGKNTYTRNYGDEILGSYFEKSEYKTKYYVRITQNSEDEKVLILKAEINVHTETDEDDEGRIYSTKYIDLDKVFLPNGDSLDFDDCQLELNQSTYCRDQNGNRWDIELTNKKIQ